MSNATETTRRVSIKDLKPGQPFTLNGVRCVFVILERKGKSDFRHLVYRYEGSATEFYLTVIPPYNVEVANR
jgi:hypothetical protein